jgi:biotin synthase-like enzyme
MMDLGLKYDWSYEEIARIYHLPLLDLIYKAATVHRLYHDASKTQVLSVKTGDYPRNCGCCSQSVHYQTRIKVHMSVKTAKESSCGGIEMGEKEADRIRLLQTLATMKPHPESVSVINGTSQENVWELLRVIATARILMPCSTIHLSAESEFLSPEALALCFLAGANSILSDAYCSKCPE